MSEEIRKVPYNIINKEQIELLPLDLQEGRIHTEFVIIHPQMGYTVCGHRTRNSETHENGHYYCLRPAGWGTDHSGKGFCKLHGGTGTKKTAGGKYSKYIKTKALAQKHLELMRDPEILNLSEEIAVLRTVLTEILEFKEKILKEIRASKNSPLDLDNAEKKYFGSLNFLQDTVEKISRVVESKNRIEHGEKHVIKIEMIQVVLVQVVNILKKYVTDRNILSNVALELKSLHLPEE